MANWWGNKGNNERLYFLFFWKTTFCWAPKSLQMVIAAMKWKTLAPWKKRYDQPRQHFKKWRHYFAKKVHLVKAMVFPVVMYGCESWIIKKAERRRIDAFELWCWRRLLRVPWTSRWSNQSILKEISPGCSLEGLMLKLKLQYFGYLMWRSDSFEKTPMVGGEGDDRGWAGWISLQSKGLSRVFSTTTVQKHQFFGAQLSLWSNSHIHTWLLGKP